MKRLETIRSVLMGFEEVRLAYLFGSVAQGTARPSSDLDVALLMSPAVSAAVREDVAAALEQASGRTLDLVDLALAPPLLAHEIVASGRLLFARDDAERVRFVTRALARYNDTAHLRSVQHGYLRERVEARGATTR